MLHEYYNGFQRMDTEDDEYESKFCTKAIEECRETPAQVADESLVLNSEIVGVCISTAQKKPKLTDDRFKRILNPKEYVFHDGQLPLSFREKDIQLTDRSQSGSSSNPNISDGKKGVERTNHKGSSSAKNNANSQEQKSTSCVLHTSNGGFPFVWIILPGLLLSS